MPTYFRDYIYVGNIGTPSVFSAPNFIGNVYTGATSFVARIQINENFSNDQQVVLDTRGPDAPIVESITFNGVEQKVFDAKYYDATVTQTNGTVETSVNVGIFYTELGNVFVTEFAELGQLDNRIIESIKIDKVIADPFINLDVSSTLTGTSFGNGPSTGGNTAPEFTNVDNGTFINVAENTTFVVNTDAFDADGDALINSIVGGADAGRFTIDPNTGELRFITPPDFEGENSAVGNDDIYDVTVQVSDGRGGVDTADLFINVTDVPEGGPSGNGPVDGENFNEVMTPGYNDANAPTNNGGDFIDGPDGDNDLIFGNGGNDTIDAGAGNDTVFGDGGPSALGGGSGNPTALDIGSLSGNTLTSADGSISAAVDFGEPGGFGGWRVINPGFNGARDELFYADTVIEGRKSELTLNFDGPIDDLSFTIFDVNAASWDDKVTVIGVAADGRTVPVTFTDVDDQFVNGNVIEGRSSGSTARGAELNENNLYNVTANISEPIVELRVILESQEGGPSGSGYVALGGFQLKSANTAPETFEEILAATDVAGGDDVLQGNPGSDQLWGEGGNDTIVINDAADGAGDIVVGGNGPNPFVDNDTLDLRGAGPVTINATADATDAGAQSGTVTFANGSTLQFFQIETILTDPDNGAPSFTNVFQGQTLQVDENTTFVVDADATDPDNDALTYAITGGADAGRFQIDPATGALSFISAPDFEGENSAIGNDDIYDVQITVTDPAGLSDTVDLFVNVNDVNEVDPALTITAAPGTPTDPATGNPLTTENGAPAQIVITRNGPIDQPLVVTLTDSDPSETDAPATVTIPAGQSSVTVDIPSVDDSDVDGPQVSTITATAPGITPGSIVVTVGDDDVDPVNLPPGSQ